MSTRKIISIDHEKCNGCGVCIPNCPEGALQIIDGKARLVSDLSCDGLGACIGHCPEGAITIVEREAASYDERRVMAGIAPQGANTIRAHLAPEEIMSRPEASGPESQLGNWPIQLHLLSPMSPQLAGKDILLSADCVAHAVVDFHGKLLAGKALAIGCPKLDQGKDVYRDKIVALIDNARISTLTVAMMEVPCCRGLLALAQDAVSRAHRKIPLKAIIVSISGGEILQEEWI